MALHVAPIDFVSLYGTNGLGLLVGDTQSGSVSDRKNAINQAHTELASIKGYWRKRSYDYTSGSTVPLVDGTRAYNTPTTAGAVFDSPYRLYYRQSGRYRDVPFVGDEEYLMRSATQSNDKGYPQFARLVQTASAVQIELDRAIDQGFITTIGTLTLEYWIRVVHLSGDTDQPILPGNLRHHILPVAGVYYGTAQGDAALVALLRPEADRARATIMKHDLTRTGRPRVIRPRGGYDAQSVRWGSQAVGMMSGDDYGD